MPKRTAATDRNREDVVQGFFSFRTRSSRDLARSFTYLHRSSRVAAMAEATAVSAAIKSRRLLSERRWGERRMHRVGRPLTERPPMHHRALRRAIPAAATLLGLAALAAPSSYAAAPAGGGGGGVIVPAVDVDYNTAAISLSGFPAASAETITVVRDGVTVATGTGTTTGAADPAG